MFALCSKLLRVSRSHLRATNNVSLSTTTNSSPYSKIQEDLHRKFNNGRVKLYLPPVPKPTEHLQSASNAVCLLVGWTDAIPRVVAKYASLYTDMGIPCLALAPSLFNIWFSSSANRVCDTVLKTLDSLAESESSMSLILHTFSGGGYVVYPRLLEEWSQPDSILHTSVNPKCIIFESGPSDFSYREGLAASKLLRKQGTYNIMTQYMANVAGCATTFCIRNQKRAVLRSALASDLLNLPQLYLHSKGDSVCIYSWVTRIIDEQKKKGRQVSSQCWEKPEHLRLYLEHKDEYTQCIKRFLEESKL